MSDDTQNLNVQLPRDMMLKVRELKRKAREYDKDTKVADVITRAVNALHDAEIGNGVKKFMSGGNKKSI